MTLRDDLKTVSKIDQHKHMYTGDQLRNCLQILIRIAREHINARMIEDDEGEGFGRCD